MLRFVFSHVNCFPQPFPGLPILCPQTPHTAAGHAVPQAHSSSGAERTRLFGKVTGAAASLHVSAVWPQCLQCFSMLGFHPRLPSFPSSCPAAAALFGERRHKVTCCCKPSRAQQGSARHTRLWEGRRWWRWGNSSIVTEKLPAEQEHYSSTSGGGARCSWKVSFWKTLLVAGSPCATLSSPCFSPWVRDSSVRRASCKTKPRQRHLRPLKRSRKVQKDSESSWASSPAAVRETLPREDKAVCGDPTDLCSTTVLS